VITLADSGGTSELVSDRRTGRVATGVRELASAIDELTEDRGLAERLGIAGMKRIDELEISWDTVIGKLTR
jgi:glycosyltransferase involved in cell wall biosynthesis